jgi:8-oxo-dGTP pyrophosphatase MutT (NUDIX family)
VETCINPIHKIGGCVLCADKILLVRPVKETAPLVLPRGTRAYFGANGELVDARTVQEAIQNANTLEPTIATAQRELLEEAGIPFALSDQRKLHELTTAIYHSPSGKGDYPILWYLLRLQPSDLQQFVPARDSSELRWVTMAEFVELAANNQARSGYLPIAKRAFASNQ